MPTDSELLRVYAETRSEEAFKELVLRHHRMVYFAALRRLNGDAHRAQEVAQDVFADLARKSASLATRPVINGWLYVSACYGAAKVARAAQRNRAAEEKAAAEQLSALSNGDIASTDLTLVLDDILLKLKPADREAVLLRYFQGLTFPEMAGQLKLSEDGARLRLNRAIERMRSLLTKRGVTSSAAALSGVLASHAQVSAPVNLAGAVAAGALEQIAGANLSAIYIFTMTKSTVTLACAAVLIGTIPAAYYSRSNLSEARSSSVIDQSTAVPHDSSARRDGTRFTPPGASVPASSSAAAPTASTAPLNTSEEPAPASVDPKAALMSDLSRGVFKVEALADLGCVTPRTAVESFLWAIAHGTNDDIAAMLGLTENQKRLLNEALAKLPPETRAQYPDPEHLVALFGAREGTIIPASGTVQITSETIAASNEVQIRAHITTGAEQYKDSGLVPNNTSSFNVRNGPTGWKIIVPDYAIEQIIPRIIPKPQVGG